SIIIERSISLSASSSYKLKSSDGRVVAEGRDALNDIIRYFNIQVDNPICVLNQEVSRNFLNTKNSRDKYQFFMRATLLEDMKNDYANSEEQRLLSEQKLMDKKKIIPMTAKDIGDLERKVKLFNQLENQREKFLQLNNEAIWSLVYEQKQSVDLVRKEVEKLDKRLAAEQKKLTESTERLDELRRKETECMEQSNSLFENTNKANEVKDEYKRRLQAIKEELQATEARDRGLRTDIISINNDIKALQLKIEELEQQYSNESHTKRKLDIQKLRENIDELNIKEQSLVDSIQEFNETVQQLTEEGLRHTQDDRQLKSMIDGKRLKGSRNDRLSHFGPQFSELVSRIVLYVPDYNVARDLMLTSPPDNCFQTYTEDGAVMYPQTEDQDFKTYANNNRQSVKVLVKSVDEMIQRFSVEIDDLCRKERGVQELVNRNRQEITAKREELSRIEQQKRQTRRDLVDQQSELQRLESIGDSPPVKVSTLEESLQQSSHKKSELDLCVEETKDEKDRLSNQYQELDDEYRLRKTEYEDLLASRHPLKESLEKCKSDICTHQTALNEFQKKVADTESLNTEEETKLAVKESEYEVFERQALAKTGQPVRTRRSSKTVQIEIRQLQQFLAEQETTIGNKEQIYRQYKDLSQQFRRIKQDFHTIETNLIRLNESLNFADAFFFTDVLQHKGFTGSLDIYHQNKEVMVERKKAKTLEIQVNRKASAAAESQIISQSAVSQLSTRKAFIAAIMFSGLFLLPRLWLPAILPEQ
ncbi:structural maintenance of chromosomes protein 6-like, partial [Oppia nitens]|uniref:structural maintenance of chromosomes protein 6-like n=1 Tax=Oppia nitens TaxID=1686743 RepID=UPI0023DAD5B9